LLPENDENEPSFLVVFISFEPSTFSSLISSSSASASEAASTCCSNWS
uniref:Secreted protein n=1 Tax=Brugia timori TaxID=42155 RepID=A0A0R3Q5Q2_9BILA